MKQKDQNKIDAIYRSTISLVEKTGIAGIKMSTIAKEAKIATGTLYIYFKNKEELLNEVYKHLKLQSLSAFQKEIADIPTKAQLKSLWILALKYRIEYHSELIFMEQFKISPYISKENMEIGASFYHTIQTLFEKGKTEMVLKDIDTDMLIAVMMGLSKEFSDYLILSQKTLTEPFIQTSFQLMWDAIRS